MLQKIKNFTATETWPNKEKKFYYRDRKWKKESKIYEWEIKGKPAKWGKENLDEQQLWKHHKIYKNEK